MHKQHFFKYENPYTELFCIIIFKKEVELEQFFLKHRHDIFKFFTHRFVAFESSTSPNKGYNILHLLLSTFRKPPQNSTAESQRMLESILKKMEEIFNKEDDKIFYLHQLLNEKNENDETPLVIAQRQHLPEATIQLIQSKMVEAERQYIAYIETQKQHVQTIVHDLLNNCASEAEKMQIRTFVHNLFVNINNEDADHQNHVSISR